MYPLSSPSLRECHGEEPQDIYKLMTEPMRSFSIDLNLRILQIHFIHQQLFEFHRISQAITL